ncbi:flagellar hook capping FlgD N-terminal domain-containing protein [Lentisphaerota bacterium WC36G]|nr:hypothetical protein LJT99_01075 [Lentisphaerae bacterium WC36]
MDISAVAASQEVIGSNDANQIQTSNNISMDDFYKLLVAQLQHQDPTEPMDSAQTITQMAQVSASEASVEMKKSIDSQTTMANINTANLMLDKYVKYIDTETEEERIGQVTAVDFSGGNVTMTVNNETVSTAQVFAVAEDMNNLINPTPEDVAGEN